jgi:hypothetical protein
MVGLGLAHVLWVNVHGSHLLGVALAVGHLVPVAKIPEPRRDILIVLGSFVVASCISPYGPAIVTDAIMHVADPAFRMVVREWAPWSDNDPVFYLAALLVQSALLAFVAIPLYRGGTLARTSLVCATIFAVTGFRSIRFIATFMLLSAPLLAPGLARVLRIRLRRRAAIVPLAGLVVATAVAVGFTTDLPPNQGLGVGVDDAKLPVVAGHVLETELEGARVLAPIQTSWFLMYASPSSRFLVDGRVPFYGIEHLQEVGRALSLPDELEPLLVRYGVDSLVLEFSSSETQVALINLTRIDGYYPISIENDHVLYAAYVPGREALIERRTFQALPPRLDPTPLLAPGAPVETMRSEMERLERGGHADAIRAWYEGILSMRPLSRGIGAGFRAPATDGERDAAERASASLSRAAAHYPLVPVVQAYRALAAVAACDREAVRTSVERARAEMGNREATLAEVEMALRGGNETPARELLSAAQNDPRTRGDAWLAALRRDLEAGVRCP